MHFSTKEHLCGGTVDQVLKRLADTTFKPDTFLLPCQPSTRVFIATDQPHFSAAMGYDWPAMLRTPQRP